MLNLDFCRLEVTVFHSFLNEGDDESIWNNYQRIDRLFKQMNSGDSLSLKNKQFGLKMSFDNLQLDCELEYVDSTDSESDTFKFTVWNIPENTVFEEGDVLIFKYYWEADPERFTMYHGKIDSVVVDRSQADVKTTVTGVAINQDILYRWSNFKIYSQIHYYSDLKDVLKSELGLNLVSTVKDVFQKTRLKNLIITKRTTIGGILDQIADELGLQWKLVNYTDVYLYRSSEMEDGLFNKVYMIEIMDLDFNDLTDYKRVDGNNIQFTCFGLPHIKGGSVIILNTDNTPDYITMETTSYVLEEVEHKITMKSGFLTTGYARKVGVMDDDNK